MIKIEIPVTPRSKKNSQQIIVCKGRPMIIQSELYRQYERECAMFLPKLETPISKKINLKCTFIVPNRRKRDLTNLLNAIQDILVKYRVIEDDNYNVVNSTDGSRIIYEKGVGKTMIEIEFVEATK